MQFNGCVLGNTGQSCTLLLFWEALRLVLLCFLWVFKSKFAAGLKGSFLLCIDELPLLCVGGAGSVTTIHQSGASGVCCQLSESREPHVNGLNSALWLLLSCFSPAQQLGRILSCVSLCLSHTEALGNSS